MVNNRFVARILAPLVIVAGRPAATAMLLHQLVGSPIAHAGGGAGLPPCHAHDLSAQAFWQGATGSMLGPVVFTLQGTAACTVRGQPEVRPIDARSTLLPVRAAPASEDIGRPVALRRGQHVSVMLLWSNYCGPAPVGHLALRIVLPNGHGQLIARAPQSRSLRPRCNSASFPSRLNVSFFGAQGFAGLSSMR